MNVQNSAKGGSGDPLPRHQSHPHADLSKVTEVKVSDGRDRLRADGCFDGHVHPGRVATVPGGLAGPFVSTAMAMPNQAGIARTMAMVSQRHRYHAGSSHADVHIEDGTRIERLDAEVERARAREQWNEDHSAWHDR